MISPFRASANRVLDSPLRVPFCGIVRTYTVSQSASGAFMRVTLYKHSERKVEILTERPHTAKNGETPPAKRQRNIPQLDTPYSKRCAIIFLKTSLFHLVFAAKTVMWVRTSPQEQGLPHTMEVIKWIIAQFTSEWMSTRKVFLSAVTQTRKNRLSRRCR